ncbi:MAG: UvrD-helicase domain-containing protein [Bacteroidales bacterium]|nr:UvrD-helicase domain-containing protein [Bacteroidales bacterium]
MSLISKLSDIFRSTPSSLELSNNAEQKSLSVFEIDLRTILEQDKFLARSDYRKFCNKYEALYAKYKTLEETKTLEFFCKENEIPTDRANAFICNYADLLCHDGSKIISQHNEKYITRKLASEKRYLDNVLKEIDPNIHLDDEQRCVVLSDEDYTLVVAGAGAGKTTTVSAKVKYLVDKKGIRPDQILVISFTNKAVGELRDRINKGLGIPCPVTTFHKTGYAILKRQEEDRKQIVTEGMMYNVINNYLKGNILENPELVDKLILFFGSYFDAPYEGDDINDFFNYISKADFSTLRGNMKEYTEQIIDKRTGKHISIAYEILRSAEEVRIANFLYMNNIDYVYEKQYPYAIVESHKPYTPDFTITQGDKVAYIEHFGITEDGRNNRYTQEQIEKYKAAVNEKILLHRKHNTTLLYTFSSYRDGVPYIEHLRKQLEDHGFILNPRSSREVFEKIVSTEENRYIARLVKLVCTFIQNFKTNGYNIDDFYRFQAKTNNVRSKLFLTICEQCYLEYSKRLKESNAIDFEDMINDSARIIREEEIRGNKLEFKYIIVDEYQDISRQRFNLTHELSKLCNAKIIAVGDDWQSIYAYAGSDITLFTHFKEAFGYGQQLHITKTYRNAQEVIDIAGGFIQKNKSQIQKALVSPKHIESPIIIETYTEEVDRDETKGKGGKFYLVGQTVERIMKEIFGENPKSSILLLGRYGFDAWNLCKSADFVYLEKTGNVVSQTFRDYEFEFMTVHRAKGLGYDNVILINAIDNTYGFPSKVQEDPVLRYVVKDDRAIEYAEERRLFYVALTRTKNRVYIVTPQQRPSEFVRELVEDYPNVVVHGQLGNSTNSDRSNIKKCPCCGYPLQFRYKKSYGLKLWICTNEPEICDFMTNNLAGGELSILKCDKCKDGYLIVKASNDGQKEPFLGCTNYKKDKTGCNNYMNRQTYLQNVKGRHLSFISVKVEKEIDNVEKKVSHMEQQKQLYKKAYASWSEEDDNRLKSLFLEGKSKAELSEIFERNDGAIRSRLKKLGLI